MSKLRQLAGETAIYGLSSIIGRAINFLLVPFYTSTRILAVAEYGIVTELYTYVAVLNVVYLYGMETAFFRFVNKSEKNENLVFNSSFSSILLTSILFSLTMASLATPIVNWLEYPGKEQFIYWFAAILALDAVVAIPFARLRYERKAKTFAIYKLLNIFLNIGLNIFFLYFCKNVYHGNFLSGAKPFVDLVYNPDYNVEYVFISNLIANVTFLLMFGKMLRKIRLSFQWKTILKPMILYAYPLLFSQLAGVTNEMFSRMTLKKLLPIDFYPDLTSLEALSIFGACYKLSMFMTLAIQAFRFAAEPFFFAQAKEEDAKETYASVFYYFVIFGSLAVLTISLNLDILKHIFLSDKTYWQGLHIVPPLLMANLFLGLYYNMSVWFKIKDKTYIGTIIAVSAALITVLLNILLIPRFGYEGSAAVTFISYVYICIAVYLLGQRYYPVSYPIRKSMIYISVAILLVIGGWNIQGSSFWMTQGLKELPILGFILFIVIWEGKILRFNKN